MCVGETHLQALSRIPTARCHVNRETVCERKLRTRLSVCEGTLKDDLFLQLVPQPQEIKHDPTYPDLQRH